MHPASDPLVAPRDVAADGVYESQYFTLGGGLALVAIRDGWCVDYAVVFRRGEYETEYARLERVLAGEEQPARVCASGSGGSLVIVK
jgi:hypothetical protein